MRVLPRSERVKERGAQTKSLEVRSAESGSLFASELAGSAEERKGRKESGEENSISLFQVFVFYRNLRIGSQLCTLLDLCVSSLPRGHANLLCIVSIVTDDSRRKSCGTASQLCTLLDLCVSSSRKTMLIFSVSFQS